MFRSMNIRALKRNQAHTFILEAMASNATDEIIKLLKPGGALEWSIIQGKRSTFSFLLEHLKTFALEHLHEELNASRLSCFFHLIKEDPHMFEMLLDFAIDQLLEIDYSNIFNEEGLWAFESLPHRQQLLKKVIKHSVIIGQESNILRPSPCCSMFHCAIYNCDIGLVEFLLHFAKDRGIPLKKLLEPTANGRTLIHAAASSRSNSYECIQFVLGLMEGHSFAELFRADETGENPLHAAARSQDLQAVRLILHCVKEHKLDASHVLSANKNQETPIHLAAAGRHPHVMEQIFKFASSNGMQLEKFIVPDHKGHTPIHRAALGGRRAMLDSLFKTLFGPLNSGEISASLMMAPDYEGKTPLHLAAESGKVNAMRTLIAFVRIHRIERAALEADHNGRTPLHLAATSKVLDAVNEIINLGIASGVAGPLLEKDKFGETPMSYAESLGQVKMRLSIFKFAICSFHMRV